MVPNPYSSWPLMMASYTRSFDFTVVCALLQKTPCLFDVAVAFEIRFATSDMFFALSVSMVPRHSACDTLFMHFPSENLIDELMWFILRCWHFPNFGLKLEQLDSSSISFNRIFKLCVGPEEEGVGPEEEGDFLPVVSM
jgi:hypothetical protein